jgi:hypothetical protein
MRALWKLSHLVRTLIIDSIRLFLRNLVNLLMIALLGLSIVSSLRSCGPFAYFDNEHAKQLIYALDDSV